MVNCFKFWLRRTIHYAVVVWSLQFFLSVFPFCLYAHQAMLNSDCNLVFYLQIFVMHLQRGVWSFLGILCYSAGVYWVCQFFLLFIIASISAYLNTETTNLQIIICSMCRAGVVNEILDSSSLFAALESGFLKVHEFNLHFHVCFLPFRLHWCWDSNVPSLKEYWAAYSGSD